MPERDKAATRIATDVVGHHVWNGLRGECETMPTEEYFDVKDAASVLFERIIVEIDWNRILLEAAGRHLTLDHPDDDVYGSLCGQCVREALLVTDTFPDDRVAAPRLDHGLDWSRVFAVAIRHRRGS